MTGPDGRHHVGLWRVTVVEPPVLLEFDDVMADADWEPIADLPVTRVSIRLIGRGGGTRMVMRSGFASHDDLERWLSSGTREGQEQAVAQMDRLLEPDAPDQRP
jgi:uncharacterized protein YndB with AHSA1/START domain